MPNNETNINLLEVIPTDKLYVIHNDLRKYYNKWDKQAVISLADTSSIENFYTTAQYFNRLVPIAGGALIAQNYTEAGVVTAGISLYADYLITSGKEKLFKAEERKKKLTELTKDIENIYDRHEELSLILQPIRSADSLPNLSKLIITLEEELNNIAQEGEISKVNHKNNWEQWLSYLFWSFRQDESSKLKELILLNNGVKALETWNSLSWQERTWTELSRLFLSLRNGHKLWSEWENAWESRRAEHGKIKNLLSILQAAISEYHQGVPTNEIEKVVAEKLTLIQPKEEEQETVTSLSIEEITEKIQQEVRRRKSHHSVDIETEEKPQSQIELSPKGNSNN